PAALRIPAADPSRSVLCSLPVCHACQPCPGSTVLLDLPLRGRAPLRRSEPAGGLAAVANRWLLQKASLPLRPTLLASLPVGVGRSGCRNKWNQWLRPPASDADGTSPHLGTRSMS